MMSSLSPRGDVEVSREMIKGLYLNTRIVLLTPKLAVQTRLLCFWRKSVFGDLAVVAYAVPRVWVSMGGNRRVGTMWEAATKNCLRRNETVAVTSSFHFLLQFLLFVLLVMVTIAAEY